MNPPENNEYPIFSPYVLSRKRKYISYFLKYETLQYQRTQYHHLV
jgi:hypothetical protein